MPLDHRAEAVVEVPHLVVVDVPDLRPRAALEVDRPWIAQLIARRDACRKRPVRAPVQLGGATGALVEGVELLLGQLCDAVTIHVGVLMFARRRTIPWP